MYLVNSRVISLQLMKFRLEEYLSSCTMNILSKARVLELFHLHCFNTFGFHVFLMLGDKGDKSLILIRLDFIVHWT